MRWGGIIVAGRSRPRAWDIVGADAACLVPVANRALLLHGADLLRQMGIADIRVVCERGLAPAVRAALAEAPVPIRVQEVPDGSDDLVALRAALEGMRADRLVVLAGDALIQEDLAAAAKRLDDEGIDAVVLAAHEADAQSGETSRSDGEHVGALMLGRRAIAALRDAQRSRGQNVDLGRVPDGIGASVERLGAKGVWRLRSAAGSLLEANRRVLERLPEEPAGEAGPGSVIRGPVSIHPSASVRRSVIRGPALIGPRARIEDAYIGPYTTAGECCVVRGTEIEYSVLFARSHVSDVGSRIDSSVIGADARVSRTFALPSGLQLLVGPGAHITVS